MLGQLGRLPFAAEAASTSAGSRAGFSSGQRFWSASGNRQSSQPQWPSRAPQGRLSLHAASVLVDVDARNYSAANKRNTAPELQFFQGFPEANGTLPAALYRLTDPSAPVDLPAPGSVKLTGSDNRELDKLVAALGRNKITWRRALALHEWLQASGHKPDDRLCTTLIRVCAQHGQSATALSLYDWMRAPASGGGAGLDCTVYTYTAAMRAALSGNMLDRALQVWSDAETDHSHEIDCRLCTTLIEVCTRRGDTDRALEMYRRMRAAPVDSKLAPTVHAYTAAMRAAAEGGRWEAALAIWSDMQAAGCKPTGHAYSAVISACAAGGEWQRAVALFDEMLAWGVKPDVVSCTALVTALGADGQWERAEKVVEWMLRNDIRPNVRTYTALVGALANARQWDRASEIVRRMKAHSLGPGVEPNAYTYSALLKAMGDHGKWALAEQLFAELETEQLLAMESAAAAQANEDDAPATSASAAHPLEFDGTESAEERTAADILVARTAELALASLDDDSVVDGRHHRSSAHATAAVGGNESDDPSHAPSSPTSTETFSYFSAPSGKGRHAKHAHRIPGSPSSTLTAAAAVMPGVPAAPWTSDNAAMQGLHLDLGTALHAVSSTTTGVAASSSSASRIPLPKGRGSVNEVVCGALMLAYERAGKWEQAVGVLDRARTLGITPNTVMYNTAISALGKAGRMEEAETLFKSTPSPDAVTYETVIAAYGMAGAVSDAEKMLTEMKSKGYSPQDYAFCGLIAAYSNSGDWRAALRVQEQANVAGVAPSVHMYNALIAACDRAHQYEKAVALSSEMKAAGVVANLVTRDLLEGVCKEGVKAVENQQAAIAALSAAVAAAGTVMIRAGVF